MLGQGLPFHFEQKTHEQQVLIVAPSTCTKKAVLDTMPNGELRCGASGGNETCNMEMNSEM